MRHTTIGGLESQGYADLPLAVVLLNSGNHQYRDQDMAALTQNPFASVISIETGTDNYHLEDLARRFPQVKFVLLPTGATPGECINTAAAETTGDYLLVLRESLKITPQVLTQRYFTQTPAEITTAVADPSGPLVTVPRLFNRALQALPVVFTPIIHKKRFTVDLTLSASEGEKTLYPFDYIGVYNRQKLIRLGGFDPTITAPYWQLLDFSLRAWLWGERILVSPRIQLTYDTDAPETDVTVNAAYLRFYLKNIAPTRKADPKADALTGIYIPGSALFSFWLRSRATFFDARQQFNEGRRWVSENASRFTQDIVELTGKWSE
jgi:hypothetical protein